MFEFSPKQRQHQYAHDDESYALRSPKKIKALKKTEADSGEEVSQTIEPHKAKGPAKAPSHIQQLESTVRAAADPILAKVGRSTDDCPWLEHLLQHYSTQSVDQIASAAGVAIAAVGGGVMASVMEAGAWAGALGAISEQVKTAVQHWVATGKITGVPQDMLNTLPPRLRAELLLAMKSGAPVQRKTEEGAENSEANSAEHALGQLEGGGQSLDGDTQGKMEKALGTGLGDVKVHTDGKGAQVAQQNKARAVTVGNHIAFNSGQYQPGTAVGDALLAHELAHTQQQSDGAMAKEEGGGNETALEREADDVAVNAAAGIHGGEESWLQRFGKKTGAALKTGLRLQRCSQETTDEHVNDTVVNDTVKEDTDKSKVVVPAFTDPLQENRRIYSLQDMRTVYPDIKLEDVDAISPWVLMQTAEYEQLVAKTYSDPANKNTDTYHLSYGEAIEGTKEWLRDLIKNGWSSDKDLDYYAGFGAKATSVEEDQLTEKNKENQPNIKNSAVWAEVLNIDADLQAGDAKTSVDALEKIVIKKATNLWNKAKGLESDEPLYWSRIRMRKAIRNHPLLANDVYNMERLFTVLDRYSRGMEDVSFTVAKGKEHLKRVLITGFDPFGGGESNPSGIVAQMLDGQTASFNGEEQAIVEAVTFPNSYSAFDDGIVENFFKKYIDDDEMDVFMVMTISLDEGAKSMQLDRYAGNIRAGHTENEDIGIELVFFPGVNFGELVPSTVTGSALEANIKTFTDKVKYTYYQFGYPTPLPDPKSSLATINTYLVSDYYPWLQDLYSKIANEPRGPIGKFAQKEKTSEFYETGVPLSDMLSDPNAPERMTVHQNYKYYQDGGTNPKTSPGDDLIEKGEASKLNAPPPSTGIKAIEAPGGNYLSNELYYRVSAMTQTKGEKGERKIPNVHLHIPKPDNMAVDPSERFTIKEIYDQASEILAFTVSKMK